MIFADSLEGIQSEHLQGFFVGWPNPPSPETHLKLLHSSDFVVLAIDEDAGNKVVGFITAITDHVLVAYIPLLEVLPEYQKRGIGRELLQRMLNQLDHLYAIDLLCNSELQSFYAQAGMLPACGMLIRHYDRQSGVE